MSRAPKLEGSGTVISLEPKSNVSQMVSLAEKPLKVIWAVLVSRTSRVTEPVPPVKEPVVQRSWKEFQLFTVILLPEVDHRVARDLECTDVDLVAVAGER